MALSSNWQMTALFFLTLLPVCFLMKWAAFRGMPGFTMWTGMRSWFPTPASVRQALPPSAVWSVLRRSAAFFCAWMCAHWLYGELLRAIRPPPVLLSYPAALILWLATEALGALATLVALPSGKLLPLPHGRLPPLANSLSDFWGRRWNVWLSGWFRQLIFRPGRKRPVWALFAVFLVSGLLHEWVINVPLLVVTGRKCFGSMLLYFLLQAAGLWLERRTRNPHARLALVWLFVFGAVPLLVNEGMLRILHLWPE